MPEESMAFAASSRQSLCRIACIGLSGDSMTSYRVTEIWRYPVKSMQGERLAECLLTKGGIPLDRGWAVRDEQTQTIRGAKHIAGLLNCSARYIEGTSAGAVPHVEITLPDGARVRSDDASVHDRLSAALERKVTLWPLQPAENADHYRSKGLETGSVREEMAMIFALDLVPGQPMPDLSTLPPKLLEELTQYASPRGTYFDAYSVHVLSEASMRYMRKLTPQSQIEVRRFRPNFVIADSDAAETAIETAWIKHEADLGTARLAIDIKAMRCIMTTREQPGLARDGAIMRAMMRETEQCLGVYCDVLVPGAVKIGDALTLAD
jgi:uncharacterized protein YcbX